MKRILRLVAKRYLGHLKRRCLSKEIEKFWSAHLISFHVISSVNPMDEPPFDQIFNQKLETKLHKFVEET